MCLLLGKALPRTASRTACRASLAPFVPSACAVALMGTEPVPCNSGVGILKIARRIGLRRRGASCKPRTWIACAYVRWQVV